MKLYILSIENGVAPQKEKIIDYFRQYGINIEFDRPITTNLQLKTKEFYNGLTGLDGIKDQLRALGLPEEAYHIIYFSHNAGTSANWTYPDPLLGASFCELEITGLPGDVDCQTHETVHAMYRWLNNHGTIIEDKLHERGDKYGDTRAKEMCIADLMVYDFPEPGGMTLLKIKKAMLETIKSLLGGLWKERRLRVWADAIVAYENIADKTLNNPGAMRFSPFQAGTRNGFAYFNTYQDGYNALLYQLRIAVNGTSTVYKPTDTLLEFFSKYSPVSDGNDPYHYAVYVADRIGVPVDTQIKDI